MRKTTYVWAACALHAIAGCGTSEPLTVPEVGNAAPPFRLTNVSNLETVASDSLKGDVVVLNFWSTSCTICMEEIDELKALQAEGNAKVVGIAIDDDAEKVNKVLVAREINYPVLNGNEEVFTKYDGYSIPYTLVLDGKLIVRKKVFGQIERADLDELVKSIKKET